MNPDQARKRQFIGAGGVGVTAPRLAAARPAPAHLRLFPGLPPRAVLAGLAVRELGYTQTEAATALGTSPRTIGRALAAYDRARRARNTDEQEGQ